MARSGISYHMVREAARQLEQKAETVTIEKVRKLLGTGSNSTIGDYLRQWRAAEEGQTEPRGRPQLVSLAHELYERIEQAARLQAKEQMARLEAELVESREQSQELAHDKEQLSHAYQRLEAQSESAERTIESLTSKHKQEQEVAQAASLKMQEKVLLIESLEAQLQQQQAQAVHYQQHMGQLRQEDMKRLEQLEMQYKEELAWLKGQISRTQIQDETLTQELKAVQDLAQDLNTEKRKQVGIIEQQTFDIKVLKEKLSDSRQQFKNLQGLVEPQTLDLDRARSDQVLLIERVKALSELLEQSQFKYAQLILENKKLKVKSVALEVN